MWFFKKKKNQFLNLVDELRNNNNLKSFGYLVNSNPQTNLNLKSSNSLFIGSMGSGKSVSAATSVFAEMLANPQDLVVTIDLIKGATDFCFLQKYNRFISLVYDDKLIESFVEIMFQEFTKRVFSFRGSQSHNLEHYNKVNAKKIGKINIVIECADHFMDTMILNNPHRYKQMQILLKKGNDYGMTFVFITSNANNMSFPKNILEFISNIVAFKLNIVAVANYIGLPEATNISSKKHGEAFIQKDRVQFMYLERSKEEQYIEDDIKKNGNPFPVLLTLNESELFDFKSNQDNISQKTLSGINDHVDEDDIDFWNWVNSNI